jgi:hypothetical protein
MIRLLFFLYCITLWVTAKGQKNYVEAMQQGDAAFKIGDYATAYKKYFAAEAFDPGKKDIVKQNVTKVFVAIEALRKKAEGALAEAKKQTNFAIEAKKGAEKQKEIAETALKETQKQTNLALEAKKDAERQKEIAQKALKRNIEFQEKAVGKKYKGGIIFYADSTREHGLIAAEKDFPETYNWYNAIVACRDYSVIVDGVTYDDWFLPSKDTLSLLYVSRLTVGGFRNGYYWSSSEGNIDSALYLLFKTGWLSFAKKQDWFYVRAVRVF